MVEYKHVRGRDSIYNLCEDCYSLLFSLIKDDVKWGNTEGRGTKERPLHEPTLVSLNKSPDTEINGHHVRRVL